MNGQIRPRVLAIPAGWLVAGRCLRHYDRRSFTGDYRMLKRVLLGLSCLLLSLPLLAREGWESVATAKAPGEVSTWVRAVEGAQVKEFLGEVEVPHHPLQVLKVLDHVEGFPAWVFRCKRAERIPGVGVYLQIKGVWPASDRDATLQSRVEVRADRVAILTTAHPELKPEHEDYVRIPELKNSFEVIPLPGGGSRVLFQTFVGPGGALPKWLSNFVARQGPLETLNNLKKVLGEVQAQPTADGLSRIYTPEVLADLQVLLARKPG